MPVKTVVNNKISENQMVRFNFFTPENTGMIIKICGIPCCKKLNGMIFGDFLIHIWVSSKIFDKTLCDDIALGDNPYIIWNVLINFVE